MVLQQCGAEITLRVVTNLDKTEQEELCYATEIASNRF
jgi:hypothetical protein